MAPIPPSHKQQKKALQRAEQARTAVNRAQKRVDDLRARLARAEEKLTRRIARLSAAEASYASLAGPPPSTQDVELVVADEAATPAPARGRKDGATARKQIIVPPGTAAAPGEGAAIITTDHPEAGATS